MLYVTALAKPRPLLKIFALIVCVLLAVILIAPFLIPIPELEGTLSAEQLAEEDSRFMEVDGIKIHYKMAGEGKPEFILLHGFLASVFSWREVLGPLAEAGQVVAFDRPAFGLTERPLDWQGENPYSVDAQVDLTVGLMDQLGIEKAILVGNSAGGAIAILTALRYPERVQALILVDPAIYTSSATPGWIRPLLFTPQMHRLGPMLVRGVQSWGIDFGRSAWHDPSKITQEVWDGYTKPLMVKDWDQALWELFLASRPFPFEDHLQELDLPVLVITGEDDRIVPADQSIRLARELPDAELAVLPECGHIPHEECPLEFLHEVEQFLDSIAGGPAVLDFP